MAVGVASRISYKVLRRNAGGDEGLLGLPTVPRGVGGLEGDDDDDENDDELKNPGDPVSVDPVVAALSTGRDEGDDTTDVTRGEVVVANPKANVELDI